MPLNLCDVMAHFEIFITVVYCNVVCNSIKKESRTPAPYHVCILTDAGRINPFTRHHVISFKIDSFNSFCRSHLGAIN